jgi:hypothetical protein
MVGDHLPPHGQRPAGGVLVEPGHLVANVEHAPFESESLNDVEPALLIDPERHGIRQPGLGREEIHLEPRRRLEARDDLLSVIAGRLDLGDPAGGTVVGASDGREAKGRGRGDGGE